jgi:hypothetical protein
VITISGWEDQLLSLTTDGTYYPSTSVKETGAEAGDTVTFELGSGYRFSIRSGSVSTSQVASQVWSFTMPSSDVTISIQANDEPDPH